MIAHFNALIRIAVSTALVVGFTFGAVAGASAQVAAAVAPILPALPQKSVDTSYPVLTGTTISVPAGGDFQGALNQAKLGDTVVLQAGATYSGTFTLTREDRQRMDRHSHVRCRIAAFRRRAGASPPPTPRSSRRSLRRAPPRRYRPLPEPITTDSSASRSRSRARCRSTTGSLRSATIAGRESGPLLPDPGSRLHSRSAQQQPAPRGCIELRHVGGDRLLHLRVSRGRCRLTGDRRLERSRAVQDRQQLPPGELART